MRRIKSEISQMALLGIVGNCRQRTALLRRVLGVLEKREKYFFFSLGRILLRVLHRRITCNDK